MLHIIKSQSALVDALRIAHPTQDDLILIEEAIYGATMHSPLFTALKAHQVHVLHSDASARGMTSRLSPSYRLIDHGEFVDLTVSHETSLTWD